MLTFKDHVGQSFLRGMSERKRDIPGTQRRRDIRGCAMKLDGRALAFWPHHFDITPSYATAPTRAERFHSGFFGGEAGGITFKAPGPPFAVTDFSVGEDATKKAVAETLDGFADARHFSNVDSGAENHRDIVNGAGGIRNSGSTAQSRIAIAASFATSVCLIHHQSMRVWRAKWVLTIFSGLLGTVLLSAQVDLTGDVRAQLAQNGFSGAESELRNYKAQHGVTPEYLEALSWMARGAAAAGRWDQAESYARETRDLSEQQLTASKHKLDAEPHLPIALGAAYEVLAQVMVEKGHHAEAVSVLRSALTRYGDTSIRARLQKNLNLLALVGRPAPPLHETEYLGPKPPTLASLKGSPVLLFFWAHWCVDCKAEVPVIARLRHEFALDGLVVIGPTQLYGYAAQGADAAPAQERAYIESVRERYYGSLEDMPVPLSKQNFDAYGASTTPTLVIVNRAGQVAMYHPGALSYEELRSAVQKAVAR